MKNKFNFWHMLLLILVGTVIFNIVLHIVLLSNFSDISFSKFFDGVGKILIMSILTLIITPAPIGLLIYAISIEKLYTKNIIKNIWQFSLLGGVIGVTILLFIALLLKMNADLELYPVIFISHFLTTLLIYYKKFKGLTDEKNFTNI